MIEVHAALMLHESGQKINEDNMKKVLSSVGASVEEARIKALVAALEGVNIDEALKEAVSFTTAAPQASDEKKEEKKEEEEAKAAEQASAGLSSLFG